MLNVALALDWSPNTLHCGFLLAQARGWYEQAGIHLHLLSPEEDQYLVTPAKKVVSGQAHLAIAPSESLISYATLRQPKDLIAVAAILQHDLSSIVTLGTSGLNRPCKLDGKIYGSYGARFEDLIVQQMIRNDGGCGLIRSANPPKLEIWQYFLNGKIDATWIFEPWEGLMQCGLNADLNRFRLADYNIPYGYSPVLVCSHSFYNKNVEGFLLMMRITSEAYQFCANNPEQAALELCNASVHTNFSNPEFVAKSLSSMSMALLDETGKWGTMKDEVWRNFAKWLDDNHVVRDMDGQHNLKVTDIYPSLYTNELLPRQ
jgi:NitT/TauT family transport system substrate-binding protein